MGKKPTFRKLVTEQRKQLFGQCCAEYCRRYKRREIPDLVLKTFVRYIEGPAQPNLEEGVGKLHEMMGRYDELERDAKAMGIGEDTPIGQEFKKSDDEEKV